MARSLENLASSLLPLTTDEDLIKSLKDITMYSQLSATQLTNLYNLVAPDAFKE